MDPLEEAVRQRLGGLTNPLPKPFTFKDARVLKEPWLWLLYFAAKKADGSFVVKSVDIEDDLGNEGPLALSVRRRMTWLWRRFASEETIEELMVLWRNLAHASTEGTFRDAQTMIDNPPNTAQQSKRAIADVAMHNTQSSQQRPTHPTQRLRQADSN
jgi:DNA-binding MltR family transcriptional regulator